MAIKLLIGGSPCTYWSIAQKNNREVAAEGLGWELFKNYLIAKEKFKPDFFLYENNKSASEEIKNQIRNEFGVGENGVEFTYINSALVSAQKRERFYVTNFGKIEQPKDRQIYLEDILESGYDLTLNDKSYCLTASYGGACAWNTLERKQRSMVTEPVRVGSLPRPNGELSNSQAMRIYGINGKSVNLTANGGGMGRKTGLYAIPIKFDENDIPKFAQSVADGKTYEVYAVADGKILINGKHYPCKLDNGYYIVRKLTVKECERLQTLPDGYCKAVSNAQAYKAIGNGWTAEVIIHLLNHALKDVPRDTEIVTLSLYDGIGTGRYVLDKMGFTNVTYYAYEIDKYAMQIARDNYPNIIECGDAFSIRENSWKPPGTRSQWLDDLLGGD